MCRGYISSEGLSVLSMDSVGMNLQNLKNLMLRQDEVHKASTCVISPKRSRSTQEEDEEEYVPENLFMPSLDGDVREEFVFPFQLPDSCWLSNSDKSTSLLFTENAFQTKNHFFDPDEESFVKKGYCRNLYCASDSSSPSDVQTPPRPKKAIRLSINASCALWQLKECWRDTSHYKIYLTYHSPCSFCNRYEDGIQKPAGLSCSSVPAWPDKFADDHVDDGNGRSYIVERSVRTIIMQS